MKSNTTQLWGAKQRERTSRVATLDHELANVAMELRSIVLTCRAQCQEILEAACTPTA